MQLDRKAEILVALEKGPLLETEIAEKTKIPRTPVRRHIEGLGERVYREEDGRWRLKSLEERIRERLLKERVDAIRRYRECLPILGQFSAEQYAEPPGLRGFLARWRRVRRLTRDRRRVMREILAEDGED